MEINEIEELGEFIKTTRKNQSLTQSDVAAACNVGVRYIVDLEKGKKTCEIGKAIQVIKALGLKINIE